MRNPKTCCIFATSNKEVNGAEPHQSNPKQKQNDMKIYILNVMFTTPDDTQTQSQPYTTKEKAMEALKEAVSQLKKDERIDKKLATHKNDEDDVWLHDADDNWFGDFSIHIFVRECETDMPFEPNLE